MKLNLGCGYKKLEGYINIDNRACCKPDLVFDITNKFVFKDSTIEEVRAFDILEHIPIGKTINLIEEIFRILEPNGKFIFFVPSTDGRGAFQDPTHCSFWNINSWFYYMDDAYRDLYGIRAKFIGNIWDVVTNKECNIIHTMGEIYAVKQKENTGFVYHV